MHLLHAAQYVEARVLSANLYLLFSLSLTPFATAWVGENHSASMPVVLYGGRSFICFICFICLKIAYFILTRTLIFYLGQKSMLAAAIGKDTKGLALLVVYFVSISLSFTWPLAACAGYALVAVMWLLPDLRIENRLREGE